MVTLTANVKEKHQRHFISNKQCKPTLSTQEQSIPLKNFN